MKQSFIAGPIGELAGYDTHTLRVEEHRDDVALMQHVFGLSVCPDYLFGFGARNAIGKLVDCRINLPAPVYVGKTDDVLTKDGTTKSKDHKVCVRGFLPAMLCGVEERVGHLVDHLNRQAENLHIAELKKLNRPFLLLDEHSPVKPFLRSREKLDIRNSPGFEKHRCEASCQHVWW